MTKLPTIKDVAKDAGVSIGSVSNVINRSTSVKAETEAKIRKSMASLGYRPNAAAQSMRTRSTRAIGFVVNDITNPIYSAIAKASEGLLNKYGYHLLLVDSDNRPGQEVEIFETLAGRVDAMVATLSDERDPNILNALKNIDVPVVLLDREVSFEIDSVCIDYEKGMSKAVKYLADLGHQSISLICAEEKIRPGRNCISGFNKAIKTQGLNVDQTSINTGILATEFGYQQTIDLLNQTTPPTALICGGNRIFAGALKAIKHLEVNVPEQLSVIAFDDTELAALTTPSYTVLARDIKEIGTSIGELVISSLQNKENTKTQKIILGAELLVRESCSKPLHS
ncbi:MAG: LacI family transcriptional regulator [Kangiellaceae bacterium]|nr:LacI family transcriptional regulator [Kangiellaceae bacterium]